MYFCSLYSVDFSNVCMVLSMLRIVSQLLKLYCEFVIDVLICEGAIDWDVRLLGVPGCVDFDADCQ